MDNMEKIELILKIFGTPPIFVILLSGCLLFGVWVRPFVDSRKTAVCAVIIYTISVFYLQLVPWQTNHLWDRLLAPSLAFITIYYMDRRNMKQKIFICGIYELIVWLSAGIMSEVNFFQNDLIDRVELLQTDVTAIVVFFVVGQIIYMLGFIGLVYLSVRILKRVYKRKYEDIRLDELVLLMMPILTFILVRHIISAYYNLWNQGIMDGSIEENIHANGYRFLFYIGAYVVVLLFIAVYQNIKSYEAEQSAKRRLEDRIEDIRSHINEVEKLYVDMRGIKHDMANHIQVLEGLVESGNREAAREYLAKMEEKLSDVMLPVKTGNPVTDIIIYEFDKRFAADNIEFHVDFYYPDSIYEKDVKIDAFDISIILNNALQNAYEASAYVEKPYVRLRSFMRHRMYIIEVTNRFSGKLIKDEEDGLCISIKSETGHGYGLRNIRDVAARYNGSIDIETTDSNSGFGEMEFKLVVLLQPE